MLSRRSADGRMRGSLQYHGAGTGRWAGRGAQLQNLPRSSTENHDEILAMVDALSTGDADLVGMLYQRPLTVVSDCIRGMLCAAPGNTLFSADFSAVEARGLRSEEHTSELQSLMRISYAVFCLQKKNNTKTRAYNIRNH